MEKLIVIPVVSGQSIVDLAKISDDVWIKHYQALYRSSDKQPFHLAAPFRQGAIELDVKKGALFYFLENIKRERLGYFNVQPSESGIFITALFVFSEFRKNGYGRRVLRLIEKVSRIRDKKFIAVKIPSVDIKAINFFKMNNYVVCSIDAENDGWGNEVKYHIMGKEIV